MKIKKNGKTINFTESDIKKLKKLLKEESNDAAYAEGYDRMKKEIQYLVKRLSQVYLRVRKDPAKFQESVKAIKKELDYLANRIKESYKALRPPTKSPEPVPGSDEHWDRQ